MFAGLRFRHRIGLLVALAALALVTVTTVALILGWRHEEQLSGIEHRYVPLLELDRDLGGLFIQIPRALEDAASAAEESLLAEADAVVEKLSAGIRRGSEIIRGNGGDPELLERELRAYYTIARAVSAAIAEGTSAATLGDEIEAMLRARERFVGDLQTATRPDRRRLEEAFFAARASQRTSLRINIVVACIALSLMALLSWRITRNTVRALHDVSLGVERLARGEFDQEIAVTSNDELGDLAREANRTAARLREYHAQGEREAWIKTGLTELGAQITGELDERELGTRVVGYLTRYIGAQAGAIDAVEDTGALRRLAVVGIEHDAQLAPPPDASELRDVVVVAGTAHPHIVRVPLVFEGRALGVLELGLATEPDERTLDLLARLQGVVGISIRVARARESTRALLLETQRQATAAQTANKELESFSYSVSHDLRAPLRAIDGFSQTLVEDFGDKIPERGQDYLRRIRAAAQRMAELIDDLLQLSRVSRGEVRREPVDVSELAGTVVAELRRADADRAIDVRIAPSITAHADARLLRIVLENLIGNAWKFSAKTSDAMIEIAAARGDDGETTYTVRDNGAGFDMKYADRLFGAFQRLHTDKEFTGTGIGLATVQRIVHRHGGRIWAEAAVGKGAAFHFTLPRGHAT